MTPDEFKAARERLAVSAEVLARAIRVSGSRTIYKWERGEVPIPGPIQVILDLIERSPQARNLLLPKGGSGRASNQTDDA